MHKIETAVMFIRGVELLPYRVGWNYPKRPYIWRTPSPVHFIFLHEGTSGRRIINKKEMEIRITISFGFAFGEKTKQFPPPRY